MVQLSYHPIKSKFHRIQSFVNYIMLEVVLNARKMQNVDSNLKVYHP